MSVQLSGGSDGDRHRLNVDDVGTYGHSESGACRSAPVGRERCRTEVPLGPEATLETCPNTIKFVKRRGDYDEAVGRPLHDQMPANRSSTAVIGFTNGA